MKLVIAAAGAALIAGPAAAAVSFNYELPGVQNTTATFDYVGVETFDTEDLGDNTDFDTDFGTTGDPIVITGAYRNVDIRNADQYGGAGGNTRYAEVDGAAYTLTLTAKDSLNNDVPLTYFGYWLSALDRGNQLTFYNGDTIVASITPSDVLGNTGSCPNFNNAYNPYCGNPNDPLANRRNKGEPYAFINVYFTGGDSFNKIVFSEIPDVGDYESDNHTVGYFVNTGGVVPEPATWAMMIMGFGLVGFAARRRRATSVTA
jgi:hypothetical protein